MELNSFIEFIKRQVSLTQETVRKIAENFEEIRINKNDFVLKEGKMDGYFFLEDGFMSAFTNDTDGNEVTTYFYSKSLMVFKVSSFFLKENHLKI